MARLTIKVNNVGSSQMEFPTSENNGPTSKVKVNLRDQDGNILASGMLNQRTGPVVNLGSTAVARINPAKASPRNRSPLPYGFGAVRVTIEAVIANTYYHYGKPDQVTAPGMTQSQETTISETSYRAVAAPEQSFYASAQPVVITGRAISNQQGTTEILMPFVPVKIGLSTEASTNTTPLPPTARATSAIRTPRLERSRHVPGLAVIPTSAPKRSRLSSPSPDSSDPTLANWRMVKNTSVDIR